MIVLEDWLVIFSSLRGLFDVAPLVFSDDRLHFDSVFVMFEIPVIETLNLELYGFAYRQLCIGLDVAEVRVEV